MCFGKLYAFKRQKIDFHYAVTLRLLSMMVANHGYNVMYPFYYNCEAFLLIIVGILQNFDHYYSIDGHRLWAEPENLRIQHFSNDSYFVCLPGKSSSGEIFTQVARVTVPVTPKVFLNQEFIVNFSAPIF